MQDAEKACQSPAKETAVKHERIVKASFRYLQSPFVGEVMSVRHKRTGPTKPISVRRKPEGSGMPVWADAAIASIIAGLMGTESNRWIRLVIGLSLPRLPSLARRRHCLRKWRKQTP